MPRDASEKGLKIKLVSDENPRKSMPRFSKSRKVSTRWVEERIILAKNMDKNRKNSPLVKVKDAILVRSDRLNKKEVLAKMSNSIDKYLSN